MPDSSTELGRPGESRAKGSVVAKNVTSEIHYGDHAHIHTCAAMYPHFYNPEDSSYFFANHTTLELGHLACNLP